MPIYEYRCASCGHQQEFLQKVSDAPLTVCPKCGKPELAKMLQPEAFGALDRRGLDGGPRRRELDRRAQQHLVERLGPDTTGDREDGHRRAS